MKFYRWIVESKKKKKTEVKRKKKIIEIPTKNLKSVFIIKVAKIEILIHVSNEVFIKILT